ncbi:Lcl C-terminal domain-containing protein [Rhodopirellula sallentina]|uniref:Secreted protein containing DUF1566 n=1 Tax=Rhodopirellula sallentina SM41 TaxID=1263870 RepID=M5TVM1_9BACT|nr:DUF1566 domain-containing protein [Rhodopirellula sallentina]EMI53205.1 secreted protein containing DUF1566 [Rhodopirellula sallentina SM41]
MSRWKRLAFIIMTLLITSDPAMLRATESVPAPVPDTGQQRCYGNRNEIMFPSAGEPYHGQDAQYSTNAPSYRDNGDGTVSDLITGLMWEKTPDFTKVTQDQAEVRAKQLTTGGHHDWRVPTIKELFSIADFCGNMHSRTPYIDTTVFSFVYPNTTQGETGRPGSRDMDAQYASSNRCVGITMGRDRSAFGFNFADGRIKSYPLKATRYLRCVRGNPNYGKNRFQDNGDGTIADHATGLMWQTMDSGQPMDWKGALAYAEGLVLGGKDDWRLPNVKELQSLVDYSRAPDATVSANRGAAIDPLFQLTTTESWFWSSTTHIETGGAYYVCFGQALSARKIRGKQINAHGAGAVRSDPKEGDPGRWPDGLGPQADEIRIFNYVRAVRGGNPITVRQGPPPKRESMVGKPGAGMILANPLLGRLDRDGDGALSKQEFDGPGHHFDRLDKNNDGKLRGDELPTGPANRPGNRPRR